ncbi:MAG: hypothetical protein A3J75_06245 [Acidobacteria bacterium RBG_16_68_9]|nr:MAG: hypothetical protein A3J75_06245 [Acidobacteria bacterium RBG_16_68_9]
MERRIRHPEIRLRRASIDLSSSSDGAGASQVVAGHRSMYEYGAWGLIDGARLTEIHEETSWIDRFEIMEAVVAERAA